MVKRAASTLVLAIAAGVAWTAAAGAEDIAKLITTSPANRSADPQVSRLIEQLIAERSTSAAVRTRADRAPGAAGLQVGADEILADIGATGALGQTPSTTAPTPIAPPPSSTAATPVDPPPAPPPAAKTTATAAPQPQPAGSNSVLPTWWPFQAPDIHTGVGQGAGGHGGGGGGGGGGGWGG